MTAEFFTLARPPLQFKTKSLPQGTQRYTGKACGILVFLDSQAVLPVRPEEPGYCG
jgi:hypothetical protein